MLLKLWPSLQLELCVVGAHLCKWEYERWDAIDTVLTTNLGIKLEDLNLPNEKEDDQWTKIAIATEAEVRC